jgi:hypothetical protein
MLMPMEEQQQAAKVLISAFLESTLNGKDEYAALFRDFTYGAEWLPPDTYITSYADSNTILLDSFDGGFDITASESKLTTNSAEGFDTWTQIELPGKIDNSNRVLHLQWGGKEYSEQYGLKTPIYCVDFKEGIFSAGYKLYISLCSGRKKAGEPGVSFTIKLTDSSGHSAVMSVDDFGGVIDPVNVPIYKPLFLAVIGKHEPVLQTICIATERFGGLHGSILRMEWIMDTFDTSNNGQVMYVDDLSVKKHTD